MSVPALFTLKRRLQAGAVTAGLAAAVTAVATPAQAAVTMLYASPTGPGTSRSSTSRAR